MAIPLPIPPYNSPLTDNKGFITQGWQMWLQQLYARVGGTIAVSNINLNFSEQSQVLAGPTPAAGTAAVLYTSPTGLTTVIDILTAQNLGFFPSVAFVWIVPFGETVQDKYTVFTQKIAVGESLTVPIANTTIGSGATVHVGGITGHAVTFTLTGRNVS